MPYSEEDLEIQSERQELELRAKQYIESMEAGLKTAGKDFKKAGTATLIIGGIFLVTFLIGRKFLKNKKPKAFNDPSLNQLVVKYPKNESAIVKMIKEHISIFLITLVKEKLLAYLAETDKKI